VIFANRVITTFYTNYKKGKGFPYSIPSVGPGADPGVQAVSLQVTVSHPPGGRQYIKTGNNDNDVDEFVSSQ